MMPYFHFSEFPLRPHVFVDKALNYVRENAKRNGVSDSVIRLRRDPAGRNVSFGRSFRQG